MNNVHATFTRGNASRLHPFGTNDLRVTLTRNSGFTLVEILVALGIIAIALGALMKASGNHTYSASYLKEKTLAHYVALYELEKLRLEDDWPDIGTERDSTEMADHEWYWDRDVEKMMDPLTGRPSEQFIQVSFTVYGDEDRSRNLTHSITYLSKVDAASLLPVNPPGQAPPAPGQ
jgi:general secretion pathway protein I